jgi:hypothetical protein
MDFQFPWRYKENSRDGKQNLLVVVVVVVVDDGVSTLRVLYKLCTCRIVASSIQLITKPKP